MWRWRGFVERWSTRIVCFLARAVVGGVCWEEGEWGGVVVEEEEEEDVERDVDTEGNDGEGGEN